MKKRVFFIQIFEFKSKISNFLFLWRLEKRMFPAFINENIAWHENC
jgi:hypothetical protein